MKIKETGMSSRERAGQGVDSCTTPAKCERFAVIQIPVTLCSPSPRNLSTQPCRWAVSELWRCQAVPVRSGRHRLFSSGPVCPSSLKLENISQGRWGCVGSLCELPRKGASVGVVHLQGFPQLLPAQGCFGLLHGKGERGSWPGGGSSSSSLGTKSTNISSLGSGEERLFIKNKLLS